jgi:hypothetical protein
VVQAQQWWLVEETMRFFGRASCWQKNIFSLQAKESNLPNEKDWKKLPPPPPPEAATATTLSLPAPALYQQEVCTQLISVRTKHENESPKKSVAGHNKQTQTRTGPKKRVAAQKKMIQFAHDFTLGAGICRWQHAIQLQKPEICSQQMWRAEVVGWASEPLLKTIDEMNKQSRRHTHLQPAEQGSCSEQAPSCWQSACC